MFELSILIAITIYYLYSIREDFYIKKQYIYLFIVMIVYMTLYLYAPFLQEKHSIGSRYLYIFIWYPIASYFIILFPHSILVPIHDFFPELDDRLAEKATVVVAWVGLHIMLLLLSILN